RLEIVSRRGPAERHVEVSVDVDAARQQVLAGGVDDPIGGHVERGADGGDLVAVDEDVALIAIRGGYDRPALDQQTHSLAPLALGGSGLIHYPTRVLIRPSLHS